MNAGFGAISALTVASSSVLQSSVCQKQRPHHSTPNQLNDWKGFCSSCLLTLGGSIAPSGNSFHMGAWFSLSSALSVPKKRQFLEEVWMASCPAPLKLLVPWIVYFLAACYSAFCTLRCLSRLSSLSYRIAHACDVSTRKKKKKKERNITGRRQIREPTRWLR